MPAAIEYTGLRELIRAFQEIDTQVVPVIKAGLAEVGNVVKAEARQLFQPFDAYSAQGFETRVRPGAEALVVVGQRLLKTTGTSPQWGALQMTEALIPARSRKMDEAAEILENRVGRLLHQKGF